MINRSIAIVNFIMKNRKEVDFEEKFGDNCN